jgi:hypothetical protein
MKLKQCVLVLIIVLVSMPLCAGDIYTYIDEYGNTIISDTPPPRNPKIKMQHREPSDVVTDEDRQALERDRILKKKAWEEEKARKEEEHVRKTEVDEKGETEAGKK